MLKDCESRSFIHIFEIDHNKLIQPEKHQVIKPRQHFLLFNTLTKLEFMHGEWHTFYPILFFDGDIASFGYVIDSAVNNLIKNNTNSGKTF